MWQHLWGRIRIILGELNFGGCSRTRVIILSVTIFNILMHVNVYESIQFHLEVYPMSANIGNTSSFYSLFLHSNVSSSQAAFSRSPTRRFRKKLANTVLRLLGPSLTTRTRRAGSLQETHSFFEGNTRGLY